MASITGTLNGLTTTARHYYMGSVTGTPTQVKKTSNNTYRLVMSQDFTNETRGETLILCDGTMTGCSVVSGSATVEAWGTDEYSVQHYGIWWFPILRVSLRSMLKYLSPA